MMVIVIGPTSVNAIAKPIEMLYFLYIIVQALTYNKKSVRHQNRSGWTNFGSQNWSPSENVNSKQSKVTS